MKRRLASRIGVFLLVFLYWPEAPAQPVKSQLYVNNGVDTANVEIVAAIRLWENYLSSRPDSIYDNPYWSQVDKSRYKYFDLLRSAFSPNLYALAAGYKPTVLSVSETEGGWIVRTLFSAVIKSGFANPLAITNVLARREHGALRLCNILPHNAHQWQRRQVGSITFWCPPAHEFDEMKAHQMNRFTDSLATLFDVPIIPVDYYFADDIATVQRLRGLDFVMGEGNTRQTSGFADVGNRIVYSGSGSEWYPHEFVHLYANPLFPNAHGYFLEGLAALLGGSRDRPLSFHIKRAHEYLQEHPEIDLNNFFEFWYLDNLTNPTYVFGGLLCHLANEQGGMTLIKQLLSYGGTNDDFYRAVAEVFGVQRDDLNTFLRTTMAEYVGR